MTALTSQLFSPLSLPDWQPDVLQILDEHHLVAWSDSARKRLQFAGSFGQFIARLRDSEVCTFYGRFITDLESFCAQLERAIPGPALERQIDGPSGVTNLLRHRIDRPGRPAAKFRFYLWHDADVLLKACPRTFGLLVDAISGVGAEAEFASDDLLLIHRAVYVGSATLDMYAQKPGGQFQSWVVDDLGEPFWEIVSGVEKPSFARLSIDQLG